MKKKIPFLRLAAVGLLSVSICAPGAQAMAESTLPNETLSTDAPQTEAPKPDTPQTDAPQTEAPQTEAPHTEAPHTEASQTDAPQTDVPQTEASHTEAPQTDVHQTEAPHTEAPQTDAPQTGSQQNLSEAVQKTPEQTEKLQEETADNKKSPDPNNKDKGETEKAAGENLLPASLQPTVVLYPVNPNNYPKADKSEVTTKLYHFLRTELGLNHAAACGVIANIHMESDFNMYALGDGGTSYGLCQWHNGRWTGLRAFCSANGYDPDTEEGQAQFLKHELTGLYAGVYNYLLSVPDTADGAFQAGYYFCVHFEAPQNAHGNGQMRGNLAKNEYYQMTFTEEKSPVAALAGIRETEGMADNIQKIRSSQTEIASITETEPDSEQTSGEMTQVIGDIRSNASSAEKQDEGKTSASDRNEEQSEAKASVYTEESQKNDVQSESTEETVNGDPEAETSKQSSASDIISQIRVTPSFEASGYVENPGD